MRPIAGSTQVAKKGLLLAQGPQNKHLSSMLCELAAYKDTSVSKPKLKIGSLRKRTR